MRKQAMAAQFTEVTLEDMDRFLKRGFRMMRPKPATERGEVHYDLSLSDAVVIRVWTSIGTGREQGASVGEDAIRVQLFSRVTKRPLMKGKAPIVKRTQGWRNNLQDRIEDYVETYESKEDYWESLAGGKGRQESLPTPKHEPPRQEEHDAEREEVLQERRYQEQLERERQEKLRQQASPQRSGQPLKATYTKLKTGDWGIRIQGKAQPGDRVIATRASGQSQTLTVGEIVWQGQDRDTGMPITVATFVQGPRRQAAEELPDYERLG